MTARLKKGFTLIELLIVMAILGVLAVVVLVAINPVQQLARTRDAGRKSAVTQIGHAVAAYYTARGGAYLSESGTGGWVTRLVSSGEISSVPAQITWSVGTNPGCGTAAAAENGWCYDADNTNNTNAIVFSPLESNSEISKCSSGTSPWFVYSSADGRACLVCSASAPTVAASISCNTQQ